MDTAIGALAIAALAFWWPILATDVLAYSDHLIGLGLLAWPAVMLDAPPALVVNVITFLGVVLNCARSTMVQSMLRSA